MKKTILILSVLAFIASNCGQATKQSPVEDKFLITDNSVGYFEISGSWQNLAEKEYQFEYLQSYGSCVDACCTGGFDAGNEITENDWGAQVFKNLKLTFGTAKFETAESDAESNKYKKNPDVFYVGSDNCKGWYWKDKISFIIIHSDLFKTKEGVGVGTTLKDAEKKLDKLLFDVGWVEEDGNALQFSASAYPNVGFILDPDDFAKGWEALSSLYGQGNTLKVSDFKANTKIKRIIVRGENKEGIKDNLATSMMPSQSYIGLWHTADNLSDDLTILEISDNEIKFELGIFRITTVYGTAEIKDNKIVFASDIDVSGTMEFSENNILISVEKSAFKHIAVGTQWNFTVKVENKQYAHPPKFLWQSDEFVMSLYGDGTAQFSRIFNEKVIYLSTSKYQVFPTYIQFDNDNTWEFFDDFGNVATSWKIFNYHKFSDEREENIEIIEEYFRESGDGMP